MKTLKYLALLLAAAMFLVACGTGDGNGNGNGGDEQGTLTVNVADADSGAAVEGQIVVSQDGSTVDTQTASTFSWDVDPGSYSVEVTADGYLNPGPQSVNVLAGETTTLTVDLFAEGSVGANVDDLALSFVDVDGNAYDTNVEINPVKDATLVAAQTEEQVGVSVLVTDEDGDPVPNAPVTVNVTGDFSDALAIYPGQAANVSPASNAFQGLSTDDNGMAYFVIEATNADLTLQEILNLLLGEGLNEDSVFQDGVLDVYEPIKLIVSAVGDDNLAKRVEFKSFFTNMSHLWYGEAVADDPLLGIGRDAVATAVDKVNGRPDLYGVVNLDSDSLRYTEQRLGADFGTVLNFWQDDDEYGNAHFFGTWALTKQPSAGPYRVGVGSILDYLEFLLDGGEVGIGNSELASQMSFPIGGSGYPLGLEGFFPGYMEYTITGVTEDEDGNALVRWVDPSYDGSEPYLCEELSSDGLTCIDRNGSGVGLVPADGVSSEDLPVEVDVEATYYFTVPYGADTVPDDEVCDDADTDNDNATCGYQPYEFALKDYTFKKLWVGGFLEIDKYVDQHVLTWAGEDITLEPEASDYDEPYTSTVHVTVTNDAETVGDNDGDGFDDNTMFNVTVRDVVPAELGVVTGSISMNGTYDDINHAVTWNNIPELEALEPGESEEFTFDVYARHKPGYCWTDGAFFGDIAPLNEPYEFQTEQVSAPDCEPYDDPYLVTNGEAYRDFSGNLLNGVTAAGFREDTVTGDQLVSVYVPVEDESDIWVVRPFLALTKTLTSSSVMDVGAAATYAINTRQIDRVSDVDDPSNTEYNFLFDLYPWEFTGALGAGDGHEAPESEVRDNPYARDVDVSDAWDFALDFTRGVGFNGDLILPGSTKVVGKSVDFDPIANLPRGTVEEATLNLTGNLPSDDGTGTPQNGAWLQLADAPNFYAWNNCAYLGAPQLNQPHPFSEEFFETIYGDVGYPSNGVSDLWIGQDEPWRAYNGLSIDGGYQWHQVDGETRPGTGLVVSSGDMVREVPEAATGALEYCALVSVTPPPPTPLMTLTTNGEVNTAPVDGVFLPANLDDGFQVGEDFWYVLTAKNAGLETAEDVVITATLDNGEVSFVGSAELYVGTPGSWTPDLAAPTASSSNSIVFNAVDVPAGESIRVVLPATALSPDEADMISNLDYSNPPASQEPTLPLQVLEETTVQ